LGVFTAFLAALCYALSYVSIRKGQVDSDAPDNGLLPVLFISACILGGMWGVAWATDKTVPLPNEEIWWTCAASGLIGTLLGRLALYESIAVVGATRGVLMKALAPLITVALSVIFLKEGIKDHVLLALGLSMLAIIMLVFENLLTPHRGLRKWYRHGLTYGLIAACLQGTGHLLRKVSLQHGIWPLTAATLDVCVAVLGYFIVITLSNRWPILWKHYRSTSSIHFITAGFLSAAGVLLFFLALQNTPVSTVSILMGMEPVLVACLSALLLRNQERLNKWSMISLVFVVSGMILLSID